MYTTKDTTQVTLPRIRRSIARWGSLPQCRWQCAGCGSPSGGCGRGSRSPAGRRCQGHRSFPHSRQRAQQQGDIPLPAAGAPAGWTPDCRCQQPDWRSSWQPVLPHGAFRRSFPAQPAQQLPEWPAASSFPAGRWCTGTPRWRGKTPCDRQYRTSFPAAAWSNRSGLPARPPPPCRSGWAGRRAAG